MRNALAWHWGSEVVRQPAGAPHRISRKQCACVARSLSPDPFVLALYLLCCSALGRRSAAAAAQQYICIRVRVLLPLVQNVHAPSGRNPLTPSLHLASAHPRAYSQSGAGCWLWLVGHLEKPYEVQQRAGSRATAFEGKGERANANAD
jgi:hypothetical protein